MPKNIRIEAGTACRGKDPKTSVLNQYNQTHNVSNLFIAGGAALALIGCQNHSLTYIALSAQAAYQCDGVSEGRAALARVTFAASR